MVVVERFSASLFVDRVLASLLFSVLGSAAVLGGVKIRGFHSWHLMKICRVWYFAGLV